MWTLLYSTRAANTMRKLDKTVAWRIRSYLDAVLITKDPRSRGKGLTGPLSGYWCYRIGDYRAIVSIEDDRMTIIAIDIAHRSTVYQ